MMKRSHTCISIVAMTLATSTAFAQSQAPTGPFIELEGQIVEVQNQLTSLQDQVNNLIGAVADQEARIAADEQAIADLQVQINDLEAQMAATGDDLQGQIDNLFDLVMALDDEIADIDGQLQLKQDLIDGTCPSGQPVLQVNPDGSVVCDMSGGGGSGTLAIADVLATVIVAPGQIGQTSVTCPAGYIAMNAGWGRNAAGSSIIFSSYWPGDPSRWQMQFYNGQTFNNQFVLTSRCLALQ